MRHAVLSAVLLLAASLAGATPLPRRINFQGKLLDPATSLPRNGAFTMTFKIYDVATGGTPLYTETQTNVAVSNGVFSVQIGSVTALSATLFASATAYLGITIAPDSEMTPRQRLAMAPYAFTAMELTQSGDIPINPGVSYSTFSADGNLLVDAGITADSATITGGLTASSGTFTAGGASQFSVRASSGVQILAGALSAPALTVGGVSAKAVVPSGALVLFSGACPAGWTEFTGARGRFLVGVPSGGTAGGTVGTAMADLEDAAHSHSVASATGQARSGTGQAVVTSVTDPSGSVARSAIAPYVQLRLCQVP